MKRIPFRTIVERESARLKPIPENARQYLYKRFGHYAFATPVRKKANCMDCGCALRADELESGVCPQCHTPFEVEITRDRVCRQLDYGLIVTTHKGCQLLRLYSCERYAYKGNKAHEICTEIGQVWINERGQVGVMRLYRAAFAGYNLDKWDVYSGLHYTHYYSNDAFASLIDRFCRICPRPRILPILKRNGLTSFKHKKEWPPMVWLMRKLLSDYRIESLFKHGQYSAIKHFAYGNDITPIWPQLKIVMRNNYIIKDWYTWIDTIKMLREFGKDIRNPYYICNSNFKHLHDKLLEKRRAIEKQQERARLAEKEAAYRQMRGKLIGICIANENIAIHSLDSVTAIFDEGEAMHHCVYGAGYYKKATSLLLSATVEGKRMETIEVDLKTKKVLQSRGVCNNPTKYHKAIIGLVESRIGKAIRQAKMA